MTFAIERSQLPLNEAVTLTAASGRLVPIDTMVRPIITDGILKIFATDLEQKLLYPILERAIQENEYTIREKVAQILVLLKQKKYSKLKEKLMSDENYYVRAALLNA